MGEPAAAPLLEPADDGDDEPFLGLAWAEAIEATELLRSALAALGLVEEIPRLRGDVNVYGRPMVTVGRISPTAARRLAAALSRAAQNRPRVYGQPAPTAGESGGCSLPTPNSGAAVRAGGGNGAGNGAGHGAGNGAGEPVGRLVACPPRAAMPVPLPVPPTAASAPMPAPTAAPMPAPQSAPQPTTQPATQTSDTAPADSVRLPA